MDFEHLLGVGVRLVRIVVQSQPDPIALSGHRIDQVPLAEQANVVAVVQLDGLGQLLEVFRIVALPEVRRLLHAGRIGELHAEVVVLIDGVGDVPQPLAQLDLLLPPDAEGGDGHGHGRKDADDRDDRDQLGNRESALSLHSTFACPPPTVAATMVPLPFFRSGLSTTKYVSPFSMPCTRRATMSPPLLKRSGPPSVEVMRMVPLSRSMLAAGGVLTSICMAGPKPTCDTSMVCGSK